MIEYTRKDIIMDPNDPRLEGAIGKKVYSSSDVNLVLNRANNDEYEMTLTQVEDVDSEPFTVMNTDGIEYDADFVILKKEEPKKYVPFEDREEFIEHYLFRVTNLFKHHLESIGGIWLKDKDVDGASYIVTEIWRDGVVLGSDQSATKWDDLLYGYTFLDGSPCGKEVEDEADK